MRTAAAVLVVLAFIAILGSSEEDVAPDTKKILNLSGRFSSAHGCPVASYLAISNGHVFDLHPDNLQYPMIPYRAENFEWHGDLQPLAEQWDADMAFAAPSTDFPSWYSLAKEGPKPGERLWWVAYDFRDHKKAFQPRLLSGKTVVSVAGTLFIDAETFPGSSGSCVLNSSDEVVGIILGTMDLDDHRVVTLAVGLYGDWIKLPTEQQVRDKLASSTIVPQGGQ